MDNAAEKLIIALDDCDKSSAIHLVRATKRYARTYKVGLSLYAAYGNDIVHALNDMGVRVFLDVKLFDIPMQVEKTVQQLIKLKPQFLTLHASGGKEMLKAAQEIASVSSTQLVSVAVLTSFSSTDHHQMGISHSIDDHVILLHKIAHDVGLKAFVTSAWEVSRIKSEFVDGICLVPGIRSHFDQSDDQRRTKTATEAIQRGADYLVIGRPITRALDASAAAGSFYEEIAHASQSTKLSEPFR